MIDILAISHSAFTAVNREIYVRLKEWGYNIELLVPSTLTYSSGLKNAQEERHQDPKIHFLKMTKSNPRLQSYEGLDELLNEKKPKLVFLDNDPGSLLAVKLGDWCKKHGSHLVCQSCENLPFGFSASFKRMGVKGLLLSLVKNTLIWKSRAGVSHVFTINDSGTKIFKELGFKSVSKTPLGFDEKLFYSKPSSRDELFKDIEADQVIIAYFGRVVYEKGIHILLDALEQIKDRNWQFIMDEFDLYSNEYAGEIKKQIESKGLTDRVIHIHANHEEIADYMNAADIVVLPSVSTPKWKEQYGRVIPEAMACNTAVIVSDSGTLPELVQSAGLIVKEGDAKELKNAILRLLNSRDELNNYKLLASERALNHLGVEAQLKEYLKVFETLI